MPLKKIYIKKNLKLYDLKLMVVAPIVSCLRIFQESLSNKMCYLIDYCDLGLLAMVQKHRTTPSGRKVSEVEREGYENDKKKVQGRRTHFV